MSHTDYRHVCTCDPKSHAALLDDGHAAAHAGAILRIPALAEHSDGTLRQERQLQQLCTARVAYWYFH